MLLKFSKAVVSVALSLMLILSVNAFAKGVKDHCKGLKEVDCKAKAECKWDTQKKLCVASKMQKPTTAQKPSKQAPAKKEVSQPESQPTEHTAPTTNEELPSEE